METTKGTIIAGIFEAITGVESTLQELIENHVARHDICTFFNRPPGQHSTLHFGGDEEADPASYAARINAAAGAALGFGPDGAVGALMAPGAAPAPDSGGADAGPLIAVLNDLGANARYAPPARRLAGVMVAIRIAKPFFESIVIDILLQHGAHEIEKTKGEWRDRRWADFDPLSPPHLIRAQSRAQRRDHAHAKH
jgi:hypothetical protein